MGKPGRRTWFWSELKSGSGPSFNSNKYLLIVCYIPGSPGHATTDREAPCPQGAYSPMEIIEKQPVMWGCGRGRTEVPWTHCWVIRQSGGVWKCFLEIVMLLPQRWGSGGICSRQVGHHEQYPRDNRNRNSLKDWKHFAWNKSWK